MVSLLRFIVEKSEISIKAARLVPKVSGDLCVSQIWISLWEGLRPPTPAMSLWGRTGCREEGVLVSVAPCAPLPPHDGEHRPRLRNCQLCHLETLTYLPWASTLSTVKWGR